MRNLPTVTLIVVACAVGIVALVGGPRRAAGQEGGRGAVAPLSAVEFRARYSAWREYVRQHDPFGAGNGQVWFGSEPFKRLVALGAPGLAFANQGMRTDDGLYYVAWGISKYTWHSHYARIAPGTEVFTVEEYPDVRLVGAHLRPVELWFRWWDQDRFRTPQRFATLYAEWQELTHQGKAKEAREKWQRIEDLGIAALPCLVERIGRGAAELVPVVSYLTDGAVKSDATSKECAAWWEQHKQDWTLPPAPPEQAK